MKLNPSNQTARAVILSASLLALGAGSAFAQATATFTTDANAGTNGDTWTAGANWDTGYMPGDTTLGNPADSAVIQTGLLALANSTAVETYSGGLTIEAGSTLQIGSGGSTENRTQSANALGTGPVTMEAGSKIQWQMKVSPTVPDLTLNGDASIVTASNESHARNFNFSTISGPGQLTFLGVNNQTHTFDTASPSWSGGLVTGVSSNARTRFVGAAEGTFGTGDVTIGALTDLQINNNNAGAGNTIDDAATLTIDGAGRDQSPSTKLIMNGSETVGALVRDGVDFPATTYTRIGGGGAIEVSWISGNSTLTVLTDPGDAVDPTVTDFADNKSGGPVQETVSDLSYTVTFDEPVLNVDATDFVNAAGTTPSPITVSNVVASGDLTTYTMDVDITFPGGAGNLQLALDAGTDITDLYGNAITLPAADADTLVVNADTDPLVATIESPDAVGTIYALPTIPYTVSFEKYWIDDATVEPADFVNAGTANITVGAVTRTSGPTDPAVYAFDVTVDTPGTVQLQITGTISDTIPNTLTTPVTQGLVYDFSSGTEPTRNTITVDGKAVFQNGGGNPTGTLDASGSDKLVVIVTGEHGFPADLGGDCTGVTYDGEPLIRAVDRNPIGSAPSADFDQTYNDIWYLDNPGAFHTAGQIVATVSTRGNVTAFALSNTLPGVGATQISPQESKSVNLIAETGALVIASHGMGGNGNTANVGSVNTIAPLVEESAQENGSLWDGHVTGQMLVTAAGLQTPAFTGGNVVGSHTIAAEFKATLAGATDPFADWSVLDGATGVTFEGDANSDGVQDGLAFLLGAANPNVDANAAGLLPTVSENGTGGLVLTFNCLPTADRGTAKLYVQHSNDLGTWTPSPTGVEVPDASAGATSNVSFAVTPGTPLNSVTATIDSGAAAGGKLFGRLQATE